MKRIAKLIIIPIAAFALQACSGNEKARIAEIERLNHRADSLEICVRRSQEEAQYLNNFINTINCAIDSVASFEQKYITNPDIEGQPPTRNQMKENIERLGELIERQRQTISRLSDSLQVADPGRAIQLQGIINALQGQLAAKDAKLTALSRELRIVRRSNTLLKKQVDNLDRQVSEAQETNERISQTIATQNAELYAGYWLAASKQELKDYGVIVKKGFLKKSEIDLGAIQGMPFQKVDTREFNGCTLYGKKPKIITMAPSSSYSIEKIDSGEWQLTILDKTSFWSASRYLLIQQ